VITQELVKELFDYVPETGELVWKQKLSRNDKGQVGAVAGVVNNRGRRHIKVDGKLYLGHRIVFLYHHGYLPKSIDHIDRNPLNNKIDNLRECTQSQNIINATKRSKCTSIYKGVHWNKNGKWQSSIAINGKQIYLGSFNEESDAAQAYNLAAEQYFGEFAHFNGLPDSQAYGIFN
jgi:hypothetical protein